MRRVAAGGIPALALALALHGLALGALFALPAPAVDLDPRRPPIRIRVAPRPRRKEPVPEVTPQPEPRPEPRPKPRPRKRPRTVKPIQKPRPMETPAPTPSPPRRFTVNMEATVPGGGVAVPTSPDSGGQRGAPRGSKTGGASGAPVPVSELSELPRLLSQPSQAKMRAAYPEAARRDGVEADVRLRLLVSDQGRVAKARVVRRAGRGFDAVAARLVKTFRFRPGRRGGKPVPVWIAWTYKFRMVD